MTNHEWRKSSFSGDSTTCVEVNGTQTALRDSKNPNGPILPGRVSELVRFATQWRRQTSV